MPFLLRLPLISRVALLGLLFAVVSGCEVLRGTPQGSGRGDVFTTQFLTEEEALKIVFPDAGHVIADPIVLSDDERAEAERRLGRPLRQTRFQAYVGLDSDGDVDGYAVIQSEIGKFMPFTFIVGMDSDGSVRRVAMLVYRESRGSEVARRRYLTQYDGKTARDPLDKNRDIVSIQGATMSVDSINHGVRKTLSVVEAAYLRRPERLDSVRARVGRDSTEAERGAAGVGTQPAGATAETLEVREARYVMGSVCEIRAYGRDARTLRQIIFEAFAEIEAVDRALSDYRPDSELSRLSRLGFRQEVPLSARTVHFLQAGEALWQASDGAFDLTVGPFVDAWGFRSQAVTPVGEAALGELLLRVGQSRVRYGEATPGHYWGRLDIEHMRLDPGALGKGFAVDRCVALLRAAGVSAALVEISSTVYGLGAPPGTPGWSVAVRDPSDSNRLLGRVELSNEALAVSGSAEKFFELDGERYSHIIVPSTGRPVRGARGAVVVAADATTADGWSTAACVLGARARDYLEAEPSVSAGLVLWEQAGQERIAETSAWSGRVASDQMVRSSRVERAEHIVSRRSDG